MCTCCRLDNRLKAREYLELVLSLPNIIADDKEIDEDAANLYRKLG